MKKVIILGTSGHSKVVTDIFRASDEYEIVGYLSSDQSSDQFENLPILGTEESFFASNSLGEDLYFFIAVGDNFLRQQISLKLRSLNTQIKFASAIHPSAVISPSAKIGAGTCIMANTVINANSNIGSLCILNTAASLDHDCVMGDFSSLAPGVHTGGNVTIGTCSAISIGSIVVHKITIGEHTVIGAGSTVTKNIEPFVVAFGSPCKKVRNRLKGEKYL
ncbi:MAG: acetyltransferase [Flavobacteriales bacterium]|jgi:sugar O-acyltransferase (sialic acid O-acetyltransferase NeuD family)